VIGDCRTPGLGNCEDGNCEDGNCEDGNCEDGNCVNGNCVNGNGPGTGCVPAFGSGLRLTVHV
jgi:hypothetical protein